MAEEKLGILTPKFLTTSLASKVILNALGLLINLQPTKEVVPIRCHIVILVPGMKDDSQTDFAGWPNYPITPEVLFEYSSSGDKKDWEHPFDNIARCKALQLWHGRNDDRTDNMPHLLFPGDTPYYGGVHRNGIVVACSGFPPHIDKMVSGIIADTLIGLAYDRWMVSDDRKNGIDFLT
jgi:hypothetical protein